MHKSSVKKGFTLIELLIVIGIVGLISTLAITAMNSYRIKTRDAKRVADVKRIQTALALFYAGNNDYPVAPTAGSTAPCNVAGQLGCAGTNGVKLCDGAFQLASYNCAAANTTYLAIIPYAAFPNDGSCTAAQNIYTYSRTSATQYAISFCIGGNSIPDYPAGPHVASQNGIQ